MASRRDRGAAAGCMKFLIDMNLSPLWVSFLANFGFAAVHWSTVGHASAPDTEIMEFAVANGYIVIYARSGFRDAPRGPEKDRTKCHSSPVPERVAVCHRRSCSPRNSQGST